MAEDSKQEPKIKVTDKRMFTADGELREGFEHLRDAPKAPEAARAEASPPAPEPPPPAPEPPPHSEGAGGAAGEAKVEIPDTPGPLGKPGVMDLISVLAEPIAIYLGDAKLPDGRSAENLDAARFYIDLLEVLKAKTAGNLTLQESSVLEDLLYQLRMHYVRKRG